MNVEGTVAFIVGAVLMYSAVKNKKPIDVVKWVLGGKPPVTGGDWGPNSGSDPNAGNRGGGSW